MGFEGYACACAAGEVKVKSNVTESTEKALSALRERCMNFVPALAIGNFILPFSLSVLSAFSVPSVRSLTPSAERARERFEQQPHVVLGMIDAESESQPAPAA